MKILNSKFPEPVPAKQLKQSAALPVGLFLVITTLFALLAPFKLFAQAPTISYSSPQTYTVGTAISALTPTSTGGLVGTQAYNPTPVTIAAGFNGPRGVAVDAGSNVYVADAGNGAVKKITPGGTPVTIGSGFNQPYGVAVDAAGNVYVADWGNNAIKKIPAGGGTTLTIGSGFNNPFGVAVDAAGNLYVTDGGGVKEIPAGGGTPVIIGSGGWGVAVDAAGNVYVTDSYNNAVKEIPAGGGTPITLASFTEVDGIGVDAAGNVYVATRGHTVTEIPAGGGAPLTIASGLNFPLGIAVDAAGNVYVADNQNNAVKKIIPVGGYYTGPFLPAGLTINTNTGVISGTPTVAGPAKNYTITAYNAIGSGKANLNIKIVAITDATLSNLTASSGAFDQVFVPGTNYYTQKVPHTTSGITLTPTANNPQATVTVNGTPVVSGTASGSISLNPGVNTITVIVTAQDGITKNTYILTVNRFVPATIASLSQIVVNPGVTITRVGSSLNYTGIVDYTTSSVTIIPTTANPFATVTVNGTPVVSGTATGSINLNPGSNIITLLCTAQDGITVLTYTVTITRGEFLSGLAPGVGSLSPVFAGGTTAYTETVGKLTTDISLTPTASDPTAIITVSGTTVASGTVSGSIPLVLGVNIIPVVITSADHLAVTTYTVTVTREKSFSDAALSRFTLTPATVLTQTTPGILSYTATVSNTTTSVTVTATTVDPTATVTVNGMPVASGTASGSISLKAGANTITITGIAPDGITTKTYTLIVTKPPSPNAGLANIALSSGTLNPAFVTGILSYTSSVSNATALITVTPTTADPTATVKINGITVPSGTASAKIPLTVGNNTIIAAVTAQDGVTTKTYVVVLTRVSNNAALSRFTLNPAAATMRQITPGILNYTGTVSNSTASVTVTPITVDPTSTVTVNGIAVAQGTPSGSISLNVGVNTITLICTAQDGVTTRTYTATVTRVKSANAELSSFWVRPGGMLQKTPGTVTYTGTVMYIDSSIAVCPTMADPNATVTVNGTLVASGFLSGSIGLKVGANTITIIGTAEDGVTTRTYTVVITRAAISTNADISYFFLVLPNDFDNFQIHTTPGTLDYRDMEGNSVAYIYLYIGLADLTAKKTVNGKPAPQGFFDKIALNVGANTVTVVCTAQDGITTKTYTLTITRKASSNAGLAKLALSSGALKPAFATATLSYTASVTNATTSITVTPTTADPTATVKVNGVTVTSGTASAGIPLTVGPNTLTTVVTAQDGVTTKTYTITVTRAPSTNAALSHFALTPATALTQTTPGLLNYTGNVSNATTSVTITPTTVDPTTAVKVNGKLIASGTTSGSISLSVGVNTIILVGTAQDGVSTRAYTLRLTRATGPLLNLRLPVSVDQPVKVAPIENDGVLVHQALSPNGDGINDFLVIEGIAAYPENRLTIINRNGALVYEAQGYDNTSKVFDGHSNKTGAMQVPGTYFYALDYRVNGVARHKTGFIVLKY
ncbi:MAG: cadherin-like beta sandwich domain-containing protein [Sphingobacteriales bacterium]